MLRSAASDVRICSCIKFCTHTTRARQRSRYYKIPMLSTPLTVLLHDTSFINPSDSISARYQCDQPFRQRCSTIPVLSTPLTALLHDTSVINTSGMHIPTYALAGDSEAGACCARSVITKPGQIDPPASKYTGGFG